MENMSKDNKGRNCRHYIIMIQLKNYWSMYVKWKSKTFNHISVFFTILLSKLYELTRAPKLWQTDQQPTFQQTDISDQRDVTLLIMNIKNIPKSYLFLEQWLDLFVWLRYSLVFFRFTEKRKGELLFLRQNKNQNLPFTLFLLFTFGAKRFKKWRRWKFNYLKLN